MKKPRQSAAQWAAFGVLALGLIGGLQGVFGSPAAAGWPLGSADVGPLTSVLFIAGAIGLFAAARLHDGPAARGWRRAQTVTIALLMLLPAASFLTAITGALLGIDLSLHSSMATPLRPFVGWVPPTAGLAFAAAAVAFAALRSRRFERHRRGFGVLLAGITLLALAGGLGHALGVEQLYGGGWLVRLAPATALGLGGLALGLWSLYEDTLPLDAETPGRSERRIHRRALVVVSLVALLGGAAGFTAMRLTFEQTATQNQQLMASTSATSLGHALDLGLWFSRTVATRPTVRAMMTRLGENPDDADAQRMLQRVADSFLSDELVSAQFLGADGRLLASAGTSVKARVGFSHALPAVGQRATLGWHAEYLLLTEIDVVHDGRKVGLVLAELRLPLFDRLLAELRASSATADAAVCGRVDHRLRCAPTKFRPQPFDRALHDAAGRPSLPVARALLGERGVVFARDARGIDVVSAFAPIAGHGLGLGLKNDVRTLMLPMKERLNGLLLALAALVAGAVVALRTQVRPLVHRLARSEHRIKSILEEQSELVSLARPDGQLVYVNPAFARHHGLQANALQGANLFDRVHPDDRAAVRRTIEQVLATGVTSTSENRTRSHDGEERWVVWTNSLQREGRGPALLHSVGRDVTERKRAELALERQQALLERTGSLAGVGGWALDLASSRLEWTAQLRRLHEVDDDFVPTLQASLQFYEPQAQLVLLTAIDNAIATGAPWNLELGFVTARGRALWVRTQGQAELDGDRVVRLVGAVQDITERKTLQIRLAESERFLRKITDNVPVRLAYGDRQKRYRFVNQAHCQRFGLRRDQIIGHTRDELMVGRTSENVDDRVDAVLAGTEQRFEFEEMVDGRLVRIESRLLPDIDETGEVRGFYAIGVDVTERSAAERAQRRQAATLRSVTEAIPALVAVVGADGRYRFVNSAFERWSGSSRQSLVGRSMQEVLGRREYERSLPWVRRALAGETVSFEKEFGPHDAVQHLGVSFVPLFVENGEVDGFVAVALDITVHKQEEGRLLELAERDPLTGLMNRAGFERFTESRLPHARPGHMLAVIYVDLDHFKPVNDRHGHAVGDVVLQQFAQRMRAVVRPTDAVARLGGDEFAIALVGVREHRHADAVAAKLVAAASEPFEIDGLQLRIGASAGVAFTGDADFDLHKLIAQADARLYEAKAAGRGRHVGAT